MAVEGFISEPPLEGTQLVEFPTFKDPSPEGTQFVKPPIVKDHQPIVKEITSLDEEVETESEDNTPEESTKNPV